MTATTIVTALRFDYERVLKDLKLFPNIVGQLNHNISAILCERLADVLDEKPNGRFKLKHLATIAQHLASANAGMVACVQSNFTIHYYYLDAFRFLFRVIVGCCIDNARWIEQD